MRKIISVILIFSMILSLVACGLGGHEGEAKVPGSSGVLEGENYQEVGDKFKKAGFTNISFIALDDLVTGWVTKDGAIESISIDGDENYSPDKWYSLDVAVVITYHTFSTEQKTDKSDKQQNDILEESTNDEISEMTEGTSEKVDEILTIKTCNDLNKLLSTDAEIDDFYSEFAETYKGATISFDGCITYVVNHDDYDTRYDILLSGGDYVDADTANLGPIFKFEDVNTHDIGIDDLFLPSFVESGSNVRVTAIVQNFNNDMGVFFLKPVLIEER